MNFFDYLKGLFGSGKTTETDDLLKNRLSSLYDSLKNDKTTVTEQAPETGSYERKNPELLTDEQIRRKAESELDEYLSGNRDSIEADYEKDVNNKQNDRVELARQLDNARAEAERNYYDSVRKNGYDNIKKGVARSSIADNEVERLRQTKDNKVKGLQADYGYALSEIDAAIEALNVKRRKALNDLDISYAAKLAERIDDLTKEREKTRQEAIEYNNKMEKQEAEERSKNQSKTYEKYTYTMEEIYRQVYEEADKLLSQMKPADARKAVLNDESLKRYLNDKYYYKLYDKYV